MILCTIVCKPSLVVPVQYLSLGLHLRGKRGLHSRGDHWQGEDVDDETTLCRDRCSRPRLFSAKDFSPAENDTPPARCAPQKVKKRRAGCDDWCLAVSGQGKTGSWC